MACRNCTYPKEAHLRLEYGNAVYTCANEEVRTLLGGSGVEILFCPDSFYMESTA